MEYTTNLNLNKPQYTDTADINDINNNFDIIDTQITSIKKYIPTVIDIADQEEATVIIQNALNNKGHIILNITGTALTDKLIICSDTKLEVNGTLRLKDNVNDFMLENEHCDSETERNKNITITGGTFDRNETNNTFTWTEDFEGGNFVAFGFNLRNIDNLKIGYNNFIS